MTTVEHGLAIKRFNHIDILRGVAIIMVIAVHTSQVVHGLNPLVRRLADYGQMGVQLIFVISAFTLCYSMDTRRNENSFLLNYSIRRYFRIAPLYYSGFLLYFIVNTVKASISNEQITIPVEYNWINILSNILLLNGFVPSAANSIVPGGWAIGTEVAFYILFPIMFLLIKRIWEKCGIWICLLPVLCAFVGLAGNFWLFQTANLEFSNNSFLYFCITSQLSAFTCGMSYYFLWRNDQIKKLRTWACFAGLGCLVVLNLILWKHQSLSYFSFIILSAAISFVFLIEITDRWIKSRHFFMERIGQLSYSMYIFHFLFARYLAAALAKHLERYFQPELLYVTCLFIAITLTIIVSFYSQRFLEFPGVKMGKEIQNKVDPGV